MFETGDIVNLAPWEAAVAVSCDDGGRDTMGILETLAQAQVSLKQWPSPPASILLSVRKMQYQG